MWGQYLDKKLFELENDLTHLKLFTTHYMNSKFNHSY